MISTVKFKLSNASYIKALLWMWLGKWWWLLAMPIAGFIIAGQFDWRWWVAGLALAAVAYPGILALVYFYYALSPETVRMILPQTIKFGDSQMEITYFPFEEDGRSVPPLSISYAEIKSVEDTGSQYRITLGDKGKTMIVVPVSAFLTREDSMQTLRLLTQKNTEKISK